MQMPGLGFIRRMLVGLAFLACWQAEAGLVRFQFTATVTQVPIDDLYGDIFPGEPVVGSFTFDSSAVDGVPGDDASGSYSWNGAPYGMSVTIAGHTFTASDFLNIGISNFALADIYTVYASTAASDLRLELTLSDGSATALSSDGLPLIPPLLASFWTAGFRMHHVVDFVEAQVDGQLNSLICVEGCGDTAVPEPATVLLVGAGGIALALRREKN